MIDYITQINIRSVSYKCHQAVLSQRQLKLIKSVNMENECHSTKSEYIEDFKGYLLLLEHICRVRLLAVTEQRCAWQLSCEINIVSLPWAEKHHSNEQTVVVIDFLFEETMDVLLNKQPVYRKSLVSYHISSIWGCRHLHRNELI